MPKALILDGADHKDPRVDYIGSLLEEIMAERGWVVESVTLRRLELDSCRGCFGCWVKTPGECVIKDDAIDLLRKQVTSDLVVDLTEVLFGSPSYHTKLFMERGLGSALPFMIKRKGMTQHPLRYECEPMHLMIGVAREIVQGDAELFRRLASRCCPGAVTEVIDSDASDDKVKELLLVLLNEVGVKV